MYTQGPMYSDLRKDKCQFYVSGGGYVAVPLEGGNFGGLLQHHFEPDFRAN